MRAVDYVAYDRNKDVYSRVVGYSVGRNGVFEELRLEDGRTIRDEGFFGIILHQYIATDDYGKELYTGDTITATYTDNDYFDHRITGTLKVDGYTVVVDVELDNESQSWEYDVTGDCVPFSDCSCIEKTEGVEFEGQ